MIAVLVSRFLRALSHVFRAFEKKYANDRKKVFLIFNYGSSTTLLSIDTTTTLARELVIATRVVE